MGVIVGSPTFAGGSSYFFDEFDSRRTTNPGRLCRGDADNNNNYGIADRVVVTNEILGSGLATGQPDANEDGVIGTGDRVAITNLILSGATCN
jgi:hypothetical protein